MGLKKRSFIVGLIANIIATSIIAGNFIYQDGFYLTVDYLAWKAQEDQLPYAGKFFGGLPSPNSNPFKVNFQIFEQAFCRDSGVRLQAGYNFCQDWNVYAAWTHFKQCSRGCVAADAQQGLTATALSDITNSVLIFTDTANSRWNLKFDTFNFDLGRYYCPCDCVVLELAVGALGARILQNQAIQYEGVSLEIVSFPTALVNRCNKFTGGGPHVSANVIWDVGSCWSIFGSASGALLVGRFNALVSNFLSTETPEFQQSCCSQAATRFTNAFIVNVDDMADPVINIGIRNNKCRVRPMVDLMIGASWQGELCDICLLQIRAAFEAQYWPDQWQCPVSPLASVIGLLPGGGNLTLYGATVGLGILF